PELPPRDRVGGNGVRLVDVTGPGRLKNVDALVGAFDLLRAERPGLALDLVGPGLSPGGGPEGEGITLHGALDRGRLADVLGAAAVFVHPSREECCSTAVLEAMAAGVPVVAGRCAGGTPWMLDEGRAGVLVDVERPTAIAAAAARLLDDAALAGELRAKAQRRVEEL